MGNGRDFYTTKSYLDYIPSYKDIQINLGLYIDYHPETVYHFSCGLVCFLITRGKTDWFIKVRGLYNPKGTFKTLYKSKDFSKIISKFKELVNNFITFTLSKIDKEIPF